MLYECPRVHHEVINQARILLMEAFKASPVANSMLVWRSEGRWLLCQITWSHQDQDKDPIRTRNSWWVVRSRSELNLKAGKRNIVIEKRNNIICNLLFVGIQEPVMQYLFLGKIAVQVGHFINSAWLCVNILFRWWWWSFSFNILE